MNRIALIFAALIAFLAPTACSTSYRMQGSPPSGLQLGSVLSKNLFLDASQFAKRTVKLRLRNSSGEPQLDLGRLRGSIEEGLRAAGYEVSEQGFGIVMDVNAFQMQSAQNARVTSNSGLGALLGGVAGYELSKGSGGISSGGGAVLGAVVGTTLEQVIRSHGSRSTFLVLCDVNIGIVRQEDTRKDRFMIGGNKIEQRNIDNERDEATFTNFALRDTIRIAAYAGNESGMEYQTITAMIDRLGRVVANLI